MNINEIIKHASKINGTDIHICVGRCIQTRVQGTLISIEDKILDEVDVNELIKSLVDEYTFKRIYEEFSIDFAKTINNEIRIRCNIYKEKGNLACAIRILPNIIPSCEELFVPQSVIDISNKRKGLILVTGPTGHGKTTTLAALINKINQNKNKHIITLEDPIEYVHIHNKSTVTQREIGVDVSSFPTGLRDALRQDPDIILIGEMRDCETIQTAITAAETGHLVLATLHTIDCATTISRIIDIFPVEKQAQIRIMLAEVLECIVSQRLISLNDGTNRAVFEVMTSSSAVKNIIRENKPYQLYSQIQLGQNFGMQTLDDSLLDVYKQNVAKKTTLLSLAYEPVLLEKRMDKLNISKITND